MALIGNNSLQNRTPSKIFTGGVASGTSEILSTSGSMKNRHYGGFATNSATPNGYLAPGSWVLPMKSGSMSSYTVSTGAIANTVAVMYAGRNLEGTATGTMVLTNAQLDQVIAMIASALLSMSVANGGLSAAVSMDASALLAIQTLSAQLGGIFDVTASSLMTMNPAVTMTALANMDAEAGGPTPLSPEGLAAAILNSILADYNDSGSVGEALNNVGAAGNPWAAALSANNDPGTFGEKIQKLLELSKFLGLK